MPSYLNVLAPQSSFDSADSAWIHRVAPSYGAVAFVGLSYFRYLLRRQFERGSTALLGSVDHVVAVSAQEQMRRIHARWIVAAVENMGAFWNRVPEQFVSKAMRVHGSFENVQNTISLSVEPTNPRPTDIGVSGYVASLNTSLQLCAVFLLIHYLIIPGSGGIYA